MSAGTNIPLRAGGPEGQAGLVGGVLFAVPILDQWLLHAPLHAVTALGGDGLLLALTENLVSEASGKLGVFLRALRRPSFPAPEARTGPFRPDFLGIIPTRRCNLACRYCAFVPPEQDQAVMDKSLAVDTVEWMADTVLSRQQECLTVEFFGGEPMAAPQIVEAVLRRVHELAARYGLRHCVEMATNGYYDTKWCAFVGRNVDHVNLSFDGPAAVQNLHRPARCGEGSYEIVARNARSLSGSGVHLSIRTCVTQASVGELEHNAAWFCREFRPECLSVEPLRPTPESLQAGLAAPDPWIFARSVHRASRAASAYGVPVMYASALTDRVREAFCPVGRDVPIVCPDGCINACYMQEKDWSNQGLDLRLGEISVENGLLRLDPEAVTRIRGLTRLAAACQTCFCRWHCAGGCHVAMHASLRKAGPDDFCIQTRILSACRLLDRVGRPDLADRLSQDREAQEKLVRQRSDVLRDYDEMKAG